MINEFEFEGGTFNDLLEDSTPQVEESTEEIVDVPTNDLLGDNPNDSHEPDDTNQEPSQSNDYMTTFLESYGVKNGIITYDNEDGSTEDVNFNDLDDEEKLNILKSLTAPDLSENEIETINYLRENNATLQDVVEYYSQKAVNEYIEKNGAVQKTYSVDEYSDDDLYLADLRTKYSDMSEEELKSDLDAAKENEELFKKKVDIIRKNYKALEDEKENEKIRQQEEQYNTFHNSVIENIDKFNSISMDYRDEKSDSLSIEDQEKRAIYDYIIKKDENGMTQLFRDLNDNQKLVEIAWYALYGKDAISDITRYWKSQLKKDRKEDKQKSQPQTTVKKQDDKPKDSFERHRFSASFVGGENLL